MGFERKIQHYCYSCGTPWPDQALICPGCGKTDRAADQARPSIEVPNDTETFPFPWDELPWPKQGSVVLYGGPGAGKSSISAMIRPADWISKEMDPKPAARMLRRILPDNMPTIWMVDTAKDVGRILGQISKGPIVMDSLT